MNHLECRQPRVVGTKHKYIHEDEADEGQYLTTLLGNSIARAANGGHW